MPSFKTPGSFAFLKSTECGSLDIQIKHLPSGETANFIGALVNFQDNYTSKWNAEEVYGRMDPIPTFQRTGRTISIAWTIVNESVEVGKENMFEVSKLINFLYPTYDRLTGGATTISTGPLLKLRFANLAGNVVSPGSGLVGFPQGFAFKPNIEAGWVQSSGENLIPRQIDAEIEFTVLHTHRLGWVRTKRPRVGGFPYGITTVGAANVFDDITAALFDAPAGDPGMAAAGGPQGRNATAEGQADTGNKEGEWQTDQLSQAKQGQMLGEGAMGSISGMGQGGLGTGPGGTSTHGQRPTTVPPPQGGQSLPPPNESRMPDPPTSNNNATSRESASRSQAAPNASYPRTPSTSNQGAQAAEQKAKDRAKPPATQANPPAVSRTVVSKTVRGAPRGSGASLGLIQRCRRDPGSLPGSACARILAKEDAVRQWRRSQIK